MTPKEDPAFRALMMHLRAQKALTESMIRGHDAALTFLAAALLVVFAIILIGALR